MGQDFIFHRTQAMITVYRKLTNVLFVFVTCFIYSRSRPSAPFFFVRVHFDVSFLEVGGMNKRALSRTLSMSLVRLLYLLQFYSCRLRNSERICLIMQRGGTEPTHKTNWFFSSAFRLCFCVAFYIRKRKLINLRTTIKTFIGEKVIWNCW